MTGKEEWIVEIGEVIQPKKEDDRGRVCERIRMGDRRNEWVCTKETGRRENATWNVKKWDAKKIKNAKKQKIIDENLC